LSPEIFFMQNEFNIAVIIPAHNEEEAIVKVLAEIPQGLNPTVIVVDNNSNDKTAQVAAQNGAIVLTETQQGYGYACLKGIDYLQKHSDLKTDIVVFLDGDYSDYPEKMVDLIQPIVDNQAHLVIGSRALGQQEKGAMTLPQRFGNWLATRLIYFFYKKRFTDLGPFRAIDYNSLLGLNMQDKTYGWTVEMQIKAVKQGLKCTEIPVNYRRRVGISKISGTIKGVLGAGYKIITTIFKYR